MKHLFIGGGGLVGSAAVDKAIQLNLDWLCTTRDMLDLNQINTANLPLKMDPSNIGIVYLIAAMRTPTDCDKDPETSFRINADAPVKLAQYYAARGTFIVFVSSDAAAFSLGHYGMQKRFAENYMNTIGAAILRPGKINQTTTHDFAEFMIRRGQAQVGGLYWWNADPTQERS